MIVAHRGSWWRSGEIRLAENSLSSIEDAIGAGVEIVEVDVQRTRDGVYVLMHDETLDRTTTCSGRVDALDYRDLSDCHLVIEGRDVTTTETVPRIENVFETVDGRVLLNLDAKLPLLDLSEMFTLARELGIDDQLIVKQRLADSDDVRSVKALLEEMNIGEALFMPVIVSSIPDVSDLLKETYATLAPEAIEFIVEYDPADSRDHDGAALFSEAGLADVVRHDVHIWLNTIYHPVPGFRSGGRGDELAVSGGRPDEVWGYWADKGVTIFQTDEPQAAVRWLEDNGLRVATRESE